MPIEALPSATAQAIGSTSIISDPSSIVKELLDNSLDASATSIYIEISQDTVGLIQVKDNGHGIPRTDHALVCKRAFTSKIRTVEDLRNVGGKSLGFRGEALAAAVEMSGGLTVITRVEAEHVGCSIKYSKDGELLSTEHVSHPVGTTVRISDLFRLIPVRRQTSMKNSKKTIARIRRMVQAYAMARPCVRLSLKVLKAKNESGNWMYAPGRDATLIEAAMKIAGTGVASSCIVREWPILPYADGESQKESSLDFRLLALLPKPGSDLTIFNNSSQYISIDSRPVSSRRGVAQDITRLYKSYLRSAAPHSGSTPTITDPFLCLNIRCPEGSYDANVEPLKDDVLFEDKQMMLSLVENLLRDTYGECAHADASVYDSFDLGVTPQESASGTHSFVRPEAKPTTGKGADFRSVIRSKNMRATNTMTVIDASGQQKASPTLHNGVVCRIYPQRNTGNTSPRDPRQASNIDVGLPSPVSSLESPQSTMISQSPSCNRTFALGTSNSQVSPTTPVRSETRRQQRERDRERYGNGSLDTWFLRLSQATQAPELTEDQPGEDSGPSLSQLSQQRFGSAEVGPNGAPFPESNSSQFTEATHGPSLGLRASQSPSNTPEPIVRAGSRRLDQWAARLYRDSHPDQNPELQKALEFEVRKKAAMQDKRMQLKNAEVSALNSPHRSRYLAARAALVTEPQPELPLPGLGNVPDSDEKSKPVLSPHDPRAYLMRSQNGQGAGTQNSLKLKRIISSKLPFESIPPGNDLHDVGMKWPAEHSVLSLSYKKTSKYDLYTRSGTRTEAFTIPNINAAAEAWSPRLSALIVAQYRAPESSDIPNPQLDFSAITRISNDVSS
ncbi:putative DNA mismatch repair protein [Aspergillus lucknowensis]|uniref:DNA mismatch repair protein S5 domain-containing protein n=1 Tax=Aspergillus lucknowensis TaxID=176173 RepID=A0ABR4M014_9EURO